MFQKAKEHGDDKVSIAIQTYELVDKHIRRLDADLAKFEAEIKEKGRLSQTETEDDDDEEEEEDSNAKASSSKSKDTSNKNKSSKKKMKAETAAKSKKRKAKEETDKKGNKKKKGVTASKGKAIKIIEHVHIKAYLIFACFRHSCFPCRSCHPAGCAPRGRGHASWPQRAHVLYLCPSLIRRDDWLW